MKDRILETYGTEYGKPQIYVKSPGRANIIGEHTDYNHGLVFPFAIEQAVSMAIGFNDVGKLRMIALDIDESKELDLSKIEFQTQSWTRYFINSLVALNLKDAKGIDLVFGGNLPQGSGISSSSALACGFLAGVNSLLELGHNIDKLIHLASQAENGIGLNGGTMDQTAIFKGKKDKALLIDFLDHSVVEYQMPTEEHGFYLINSGQKHNLVDTEYNARRASCEAGRRTIQSQDANVKTLRDVTQIHLIKYLDSDNVANRIKHVIGENQRVKSAAKALIDKDYQKLGILMTESHKSLSVNYEVSTPEIDYLVERTLEIESLLGGRIMGGGFGGCTINLVKGELSFEEIQKLQQDYLAHTGLDLSILKVKASNGIVVENL